MSTARGGGGGGDGELCEEEVEDVFSVMYDAGLSEIFSNVRLAGCPS